MPQKDIHYFGNESSESLLEAYSIVPKDQQSVDILRPKQCPNCQEPNKPDIRFCAGCRMVLSIGVTEKLTALPKLPSYIYIYREIFEFIHII
jgi:hypothetical protein